jgi:ankyrin repeat protein
MARLLLRTKSVDVESTNRDGDTVASYLYGKSRPKEQQTEFIEMLASHSFSQFSAQDKNGWTVLHRAAAWGSAEDIKVLLQMSALENLRTRRLSWTPLICAVAYRNFDTLQALCESSNDATMYKDQDLRGWNLLHVAVGYSNFEAVPYLIQHGVDLRAMSAPTSCWVPPLIGERSVTPGEIARSFGEAAYQRWTEALESAGSTIDVRPEEIDWTVEETEELFGECECCDNWVQQHT